MADSNLPTNRLITSSISASAVCDWLLLSFRWRSVSSLKFARLNSILEVRLKVCGRGGTGRRAGLRSLLPRGSGSSILLVRTTVKDDGGRMRD